MCTKSQLEAIEEEMVNYYRSVYGDSIDTIEVKNTDKVYWAFGTSKQAEEYFDMLAAAA